MTVSALQDQFLFWTRAMSVFLCDVSLASAPACVPTLSSLIQQLEKKLQQQNHNKWSLSSHWNLHLFPVTGLKTLKGSRALNKTDLQKEKKSNMGKYGVLQPIKALCGPKRLTESFIQDGLVWHFIVFCGMNHYVALWMFVTQNRQNRGLWGLKRFVEHELGGISGKPLQRHASSW